MRVVLVVVALGCGTNASPPAPSADLSPVTTQAAATTRPDTRPSPGKDPAHATPLDDVTLREIRQVVKQHAPQLLDCYGDLSSKVRAGVELPRITMELVIGPGGEVQTVTATGASDPINACFAAAYRGFTFSKPATGSIAVSGVLFHPDRFAN